MRHILRKNHLRRALGFWLCALILCAVSAAAGQNKILADGNPPLTATMIDRFANLMEWSLDVRFSAPDRAAVERVLVGYWQNGDAQNIKAVVNILAFENSLAAATDAKKQELQPQIKAKMLETMERESSDSLNALLLEIYNKNQNPATDAQITAGGGGDISSLVGKWQVLHGNSVYSADRQTGRIGDGNAMIAEFDIRPDGSLIYSFILQQSNFGCTTRIKTSKTGRAQVAGSRVTFAYDGGSTTSEDNCTRANNYTKRLAAEKETYDFRLGRDASGKAQFCFANPQLKDCAIKVK